MLYYYNCINPEGLILLPKTLNIIISQLKINTEVSVLSTIKYIVVWTHRTTRNKKVCSKIWSLRLKLFELQQMTKTILEKNQCFPFTGYQISLKFELLMLIKNNNYVFCDIFLLAYKALTRNFALHFPSFWNLHQHKFKNKTVENYIRYILNI